MIIIILYIIIMYAFFYFTRKYKVLDSWCNYEDELASCYTCVSLIWPLGIFGILFTYLYKITK